MTGDGEEMDSLYGGDSETPKNRETVDEESAEESQSKAVVPLKVLQGKHPDAPKEGDEIVVKVLRVYGDEADNLVVQMFRPPRKEISKRTA